jgi:hypothetical protein
MDLAAALTADLVASDGMTDGLRRFLESIGQALAAPRLALYDYDEHVDAFDLLYFLGHPDEARTALHRRVFTPTLRRALEQRSAFVLAGEDRQLAIPLYFQETLEAVLLLERSVAWKSIEQYEGATPLISRFVGLFMSSRRLPVNMRQEVVAVEDLARAREVQLSYLPDPLLEAERFELFGHNRSSALVGGDYFDYFQTEPRRVQGVVADACGHGMGAALIMSTFRGLLHADVPSGDNIAPAFTRVNQRLYRGGSRLQYLTGVFFDFDEASGALHYLNAGHFDPILLSRDGTMTRLQGGGPPLGMFPESVYSAETVAATPGDLLILFTDGLVELTAPSGEFFEVERILATIQPVRERPLREISSQVIAAATGFRDRADLTDDLTLFMMRFR